MTEAWDKRYRKWDQFDDDSDTEEKAQATMKPTQYDLAGDDSIVIRDVMHIKPNEIEKLKRIDQQEKEIWQIVVRKLRVWSAASNGAAEGAEAIPCRPYCMLINNLYPLGQVLAKRVCDPPEEIPSPRKVMQLILRTMEDPPSKMPQHRPGKVVFPSREFVGELRKSFAAIDIECSYLSESEGIDEYISEYSKLLIQQDAASIGQVSEKPGLLSNPATTPQVLQGLYSAAAKFCKAKPWSQLYERHGIQIETLQPLQVNPKLNLQPGTVWVSVLGGTAQDIFGLAMFFSRVDLDRRMLPKGEKLAYLENPKLQRCGKCDKSAKELGSSLKKCTRCCSMFYCSSECQREHWLTHKQSCAAPATVDPEQAFWASKEVSLFYGTITTMPFDELDAIEKYNLELMPGNELDERYPSTVQFRQGNATTPDATDLVWLERAMLSIVSMLDKHPKYMDESLPFVLGESYDPLELDLITSHGEEKILMRNATILTIPEFERLEDALKKKRNVD